MASTPYKFTLSDGNEYTLSREFDTGDLLDFGDADNALQGISRLIKAKADPKTLAALRKEPLSKFKEIAAEWMQGLSLGE